MHLGVQRALIRAGDRFALVRQPRLAGSEQQLSPRLEGACRVRVRVGVGVWVRVRIRVRVRVRDRARVRVGLTLTLTLNLTLIQAPVGARSAGVSPVL